MLNVELVRAGLERPLALVFAQHENKAGDVPAPGKACPTRSPTSRPAGRRHPPVLAEGALGLDLAWAGVDAAVARR